MKFVFKKSHLLVLCVLPAWFAYSGCTENPKENLAVYRVLSTALNKSSNKFNEQNTEMIKTLQSMLLVPSKMERAAKWLPVAELVRKFSDDFSTYVDHLKITLKTKAGLQLIDGKEQFRENDRKAVATLFKKENAAEDLQLRLSELSNKLLALNPEIAAGFSKGMNYELQIPAQTEDTQINYMESNFENIPTSEALAVLSAIQNNVRSTENRLLSFCISSTNTLH